MWFVLLRIASAPACLYLVRVFSTARRRVTAPAPSESQVLERLESCPLRVHSVRLLQERLGEVHFRLVARIGEREGQCQQCGDR